MLLIVLFGGGIGDPCCSLLLVLRVVSVLLIVFCIERGIRVPHRFFLLGGEFVLLIVVCFGKRILVAHRF